MVAWPVAGELTAAECPPSAVSQTVRLQLWEQTMSRATSAARLGNTLIAITACHEAVALALELLEAPPEGCACDVVAALVVSRHNLAELQAELGCVDLAAAQRCRAHEELIGLVTSGGAQPDLQRAALRNLRETHAGLLEHLDALGPHPDITRALQSGCLVFTTGTATVH